jgi:hypothetical protein
MHPSNVSESYNDIYKLDLCVTTIAPNPITTRGCTALRIKVRTLDVFNPLAALLASQSEGGVAHSLGRRRCAKGGSTYTLCDARCAKGVAL